MLAAVANQDAFTCKCGMPTKFTESNIRFNSDRLAEQKGIRLIGQTFHFNYQSTCTGKCGLTYTEKVLRRKN